MEEGREGWGRVGRQNTCVRGGVVGGTGVSHPVRDRGGWGQRHRGEGAGKRLCVPPISPGPPHGLGRRPRTICFSRSRSFLVSAKVGKGFMRVRMGVTRSKRGLKPQRRLSTRHSSVMGPRGCGECPPSSSSDGRTRPQRDRPEQADGRRSQGTGSEFDGGRGTKPQGHPRSGEQYRPARERCHEVRP
jgi:hypothetical protein